jgi:hypothetical protein
MHMNTAELRRTLVTAFPTLKKPWFGDNPIMCRDGEYPDVGQGVYRAADARVWGQVVASGLQYAATFPDCDDYADIKLGLFKLRWWELVRSGTVPTGCAPSYAVCEGYNPQGQMHSFNLFVAGGAVFISDYGQIVEPDGYRPLKARF